LYCKPLAVVLTPSFLPFSAREIRAFLDVLFASEFILFGFLLGLLFLEFAEVGLNRFLSVGHVELGLIALGHTAGGLGEQGPC